LVKWEGYSHDENTWEKYENVSDNAVELLKEYYEKNSTIEGDGRYGKERK